MHRLTFATFRGRTRAHTLCLYFTASRARLPPLLTPLSSFGPFIKVHSPTVATVEINLKFYCPTFRNLCMLLVSSALSSITHVQCWLHSKFNRRPTVADVRAEYMHTPCIHLVSSWKPNLKLPNECSTSIPYIQNLIKIIMQCT